MIFYDCCDSSPVTMPHLLGEGDLTCKTGNSVLLKQQALM